MYFRNTTRVSKCSITTMPDYMFGLIMCLVQAICKSVSRRQASSLGGKKSNECVVIITKETNDDSSEHKKFPANIDKV